MLKPLLRDLTIDRSIIDEISRRFRIDILVVADTIVSFGSEHDPANLMESYFGMSHLLGVLRQVGHVTCAHRTSDPLGAPSVVPNFRFDQHDLSVYDQIWLLGYDSGMLPPAEQAAVAAFMNKGGGVFATGDHASLGSALAGNLPRVRSMRHWNSPPPPLGPTRVDTTQPDANNIVVFENQSDDIPQTLKLKWYEWSNLGWLRRVYPHPLLCSSSGPIKKFPDHMHEGEVVEPADLNQTITLGGSTFDEYPKDANGVRIAPEVVAWGYSTGRADPEVMSDVHVGDDEPSNARWSGTICAYDGKRAGVGRVVCHSTWHHFFDINLIGDNAANRASVTDPRKYIWQKGFTYSPAGQQVLAGIDQYYRNIVHWLSPGVGIFNQLEPIVAQLLINHRVREVIEGGEVSAFHLGAYAWQYVLRLAPPCTIIELLFDPLRDYLRIPPFPWRSPIPDPGPEGHFGPIPAQEMAQAALGGALLAGAKLESIEELVKGRDHLRAGMAEAVGGLIRQTLAQSERGVKELASALDGLGSKQAR
jgi:hypothetical protein